MIIILYALLIFLGLKLAYNVAVPYQLLCKQDEKAGVSIMIVIEWLLLALSLIVSIILKPEANVLQFWPLLGIGAGAIVASYLHLGLTMMIGGWIIGRKR